MRSLIDTWLGLPGVPPSDLAHHGVSYRSALKCGSIRRGRRGRWIVGVWADPPSPWHWVDDPVLEDLVIFDPARPYRFRTVYESGAALLGEEAFREARVDHLPLPVFRTPLCWLQRAGAGVVPLDLSAFGREMLGADIELIAENKTHAVEIKRVVSAASKLVLPKFRIAA